MLPLPVAKYFSDRHIDEKTLDKFGIYWNGEKIVIPIRDEKGKWLFNKYRRDPKSVVGPKYLYDRGSSVALFNYNPEANTVVLVEGELDCVLLSTLGYDSCSSTGGSQAFPDDWWGLFENKDLYLCYDKDQAGARGAIKVATLWPKAKIVVFPEIFTGKDVSDYLIKHPIEAFDKLVKLAFTLPTTITDCVAERRRLKGLGLSTLVIEEQLKILNKAKEAKKKVKAFTDVKSIKEVPITNFLKFTGTGFTKCLWHSPDKTPSLKYYPKDNRLYCFASCGHKDVIDVVRHINGCTFPEAVDILKKMI